MVTLIIKRLLARDLDIYCAYCGDDFTYTDTVYRLQIADKITYSHIGICWYCHRKKAIEPYLAGRTVNQVAQLLGLTVRTIYRWRDNNVS
jgi:hypothetical protein